MLSRLAAFILCILFVPEKMQVFGQLYKVPLNKNITIGPLGSTVIFFENSDTTSPDIPLEFEAQIRKSTVQYKFIDFDFNKQTFESYKQGVISYHRFIQKFKGELRDTLLYAIENIKNVDSRIDAVVCRDTFNNFICFIDINNNNQFDDGVILITQRDIIDSHLPIYKDIVLEKIHGFVQNTIFSRNIPIRLNLKANGVNNLTENENLNLALEYSENYIAYYEEDKEKYQLSIRSFLPASVLHPDDVLIYFDDVKLKSNLRNGDMPFKLTDTIIHKGKEYSFFLGSNTFDSIYILKHLSDSIKSDNILFRLIDNHNIKINSVNMLSLKEKAKTHFTVIDFWGTWCVPCISSFPDMKILFDKLIVNNRIQFLGVLYDDYKNIESAKNILRKNKINWPQILDRKDYEDSIEIIKIFRIITFPYYVILDKEGEIVLRTNSLKEIESFFSTF